DHEEPPEPGPFPIRFFRPVLGGACTTFRGRADQRGTSGARTMESAPCSPVSSVPQRVARKEKASPSPAFLSVPASTGPDLCPEGPGRGRSTTYGATDEGHHHDRPCGATTDKGARGGPGPLPRCRSAPGHGARGPAALVATGPGGGGGHRNARREQCPDRRGWFRRHLGVTGDAVDLLRGRCRPLPQQAYRRGARGECFGLVRPAIASPGLARGTPCHGVDRGLPRVGARGCSATAGPGRRGRGRHGPVVPGRVRTGGGGHPAACVGP